MADVFNTAVSGLVAFQRALSVTGNNIANVNTPGYTREQVTLSNRTPDGTAGIFIGNGVDVTSVSRLLDTFALSQLQTGNGVLGQQNAFLGIANQVDNLIGGTTNGVSSSITKFFNAWQTLASDPTSASNRAQVISQAQGLATTLSQAASQLNGYQANINAQINSTVGNINTLTSSIAKLNQQIAVATGQGGGSAPNDLLDQRDALVTQLSSLTNVRTNSESNGTIDLYTGNGQALVVGITSVPLATVPNRFDATKLDVVSGSGAAQVVLTSSLSTGQLGGLLQAGGQLIDPALSALGRVAASLALTVNDQQSRGFDQNGQLGQNLFSIGAPAVLASTQNTGAATLTANPLTLATLGQLTTDNYQLHFQGGVWTATIVGTGQAVAVAGAGTVASPLTFGGVSVVVSGAPANGDNFIVQPTTPAANTIAVSLTDARGIAAASPLQTAAPLSNAGNASISAAQVVNRLDPNLLVPATIQFTAANTYTITQATVPAPTVSGPFAYTSGATITAPGAGGWSVVISGVPATGDTFSVRPNSAGSGDNSNALATAALQNKPVLNGGTVGLAAAYTTLVGIVGATTQQTTIEQTAQQAVVNQAQQAVSSASGVNLDEEAANMLNWQRAYDAAAHLVTVADTMFQTLLTAIRA